MLGQLVHLESSRSVPLSSTPKQMQRRLGPEEIDELVAAFQAGATLREVAAQFGVHRTTVSKQLERRGVRRRQRSLDSSELAEALRLYRTGLSTIAIGQQLGFDGGTIWQALRRAGVQLRDSHGRERNA